jgi:hypothetical protein
MILDMDFLDLLIFLGFGFPIQIQLIFTVRSRAWEIND